MSTAAHLLTVDPGHASGWAFWERNAEERTLRLLRFGLLRLDVAEPDDAILMVNELLGGLAPTWLGSLLVVEGQWFHCPLCKARATGRRLPAGAAVGHFRAVQRLIETRCAWQGAARIAGADTELAPPGSWIPAMTRRLRGDTPDDRIRERVRLEWPALRPVADEHPALLLGLWWAQKHRGRCVVGLEGKGER